MLADAGARVLDAHDGFVVATHQSDLHPPACRSKFDGVVDEIGDRFDQKIAVTINLKLVLQSDDKADPLIFRYRLIHVAHFTYKRRKWDLPETGRSLSFLDIRQTQD